MDSAKINEWMQVIGIFALVASLIFVGLQMRQEHEIARVMIYQERASATAEVTISLASNPSALAAMVKSATVDPGAEFQIDGWAGPVTRQDMFHGTFAGMALFTLTDNSHFQYEEGFLPEDHWLSVRSSVKNGLMTTPFTRLHVESNLDRYRPSFRAELQEIMREIDRETAE